ncbi:NTP transferase domain-containing protein [Dietzia sp.]|uniref:NTP transferase domain-containing protein n=1 Tax=Dietzia sp. TaxID=1871616 RepID=UPI002FD949FA
MGTELAAIVLAGGRSTRLRESAPGDEIAKTLLRDGTGTRLVDAAIAAAAGTGARRIAVVGPRPDEAFAAALDGADAEVDILYAREDPPFAGPAAAIAAGLEALWPGAGRNDDQNVAPVGGASTSPSDEALVLVVGGDMPAAGPGLAALVEAFSDAPGPAGAETRADSPGPDGSAGVAATAHICLGDGAIAIADGRRQPLLSALRASSALRAFSGECSGASVHRLLTALDLVEVDVPAGAAADVDTWSDARALGFDTP